jgi:formylaminopyrimidine deformylase / aminopyrimidine aminohydrolase
MGEAMTAEALLARHVAAWQAAVVHPFLTGVRDGSVPEESFDRWLAQDYLYAQALVRAQSRIAAGAPLADVGLLAGGVVATVGELGWFEEMAARRGVDLDAPMHPTTRAYCDFLLALTFSAYPAQITAIWALERAYLESWDGARPGAQPYRPFVERWTTDAFRSYVGDLQVAVDRQLEASAGDQVREAEDAFRWVTHYERGFWDMAMSG